MDSYWYLWNRCFCLFRATSSFSSPNPLFFDIQGPEKLYNDLIVLGWIPIAFLITVGYFYVSHLEHLLWTIWEILWGCALYLTYKNRKIWSLKRQFLSHVSVASFALIPFILWNVLVTPEKPGIPMVSDIQVLDPFYTIQVSWIIPLWFVIWCYGWIMDVPRISIKQQKWDLIRLIWLCLFLLIQFYVMFLLGEYIWWVPSGPVI